MALKEKKRLRFSKAEELDSGERDKSFIEMLEDRRKGSFTFRRTEPTGRPRTTFFEPGGHRLPVKSRLDPMRVAALAGMLMLGGGRSYANLPPYPSVAELSELFLKDIHADLDRCSAEAAERKQMGDVIVSFKRASYRDRARREYRAVGVDAAAVACVRSAFEGHRRFLARRGLEEPMGEHPYHEDIPLGVTRPLYPVAAEFFQEWDRRRAALPARSPWPDLPPGAELTKSGCLQVPKTVRLESAHDSWELEVEKRWKRVDPSTTRRLGDFTEQFVQKAFWLTEDRILVFIGRKPVRNAPPVSWGDPFGVRICLQKFDQKSREPVR